jgi:hypothetical protein
VDDELKSILEGCGHGLTDVLSWNLLVGKEKNHAKP